MKKVHLFWNLLLHRVYCLACRYHSWLFIFLGRIKQKQLSNTETKAFSKRELKRPSFYLMMASLFLLISFSINSAKTSENKNPMHEQLKDSGWVTFDSQICSGEGFFLLENDNESMEVFQEENHILISKQYLIERPFTCLHLNKPQMIKEI